MNKTVKKCNKKKTEKWHLLYYNIPVHTHEPVVWVCSMMWCAKIYYHTCTCITHFGNTTGFSIPMLNPTVAIAAAAAAAIAVATAIATAAAAAAAHTLVHTHLQPPSPPSHCPLTPTCTWLLAGSSFMLSNAYWLLSLAPWPSCLLASLSFVLGHPI